MISKIIDYMIDEKMSCKEYDELAEETDNQEYKDMFKMIADQEHTHYKMLKEYLSREMEKHEESE